MIFPAAEYSGGGPPVELSVVADALRAEMSEADVGLLLPRGASVESHVEAFRGATCCDGDGVGGGAPESTEDRRRPENAGGGGSI